MVAGIALPKAAVVKVTPSQLASFTLFDVKDPFVQRVSATLAATSGASGAANGQTQGAANSSGPTSSPAGGSSGSTTADTTGTTTNTPTDAAPPPPIAYATINFNGEPQQVQAKDKFPADSPLFVVRSIKKKQAKIGVAGGSFDDSQAVTLVQGKKVTLVNTATGVRYELKLVYTGAQPEVIKSFTTTTATTPGTTADSLSGSSQTTTTTK
jgi:hypothetical protein